MTPEAAEVLALQALAWLAADDDLLPRFLDMTGTQASDVQRRVGDAEFLGAILDFLLQDEGLVIAFCDHYALPYPAPQAARAALPGGEVVHWT